MDSSISSEAASHFFEAAYTSLMRELTIKESPPSRRQFLHAINQIPRLSPADRLKYDEKIQIVASLFQAYYSDSVPIQHLSPTMDDLTDYEIIEDSSDPLGTLPPDYFTERAVTVKGEEVPSDEDTLFREIQSTHRPSKTQLILFTERLFSLWERYKEDPDESPLENFHNASVTLIELFIEFENECPPELFSLSETTRRTTYK